MNLKRAFLILAVCAFADRLFEGLPLFFWGGTLLVLPVTYYALQSGWWPGFLLGASAGLYVDLFSTGPFGGSVLTWAAAGLLVGSLSRWVLREDMPVQVAAVGVLVLSQGALSFAVLRMRQEAVFLNSATMALVLWRAVCCMAIAVVVLAVMRRKAWGIYSEVIR